MSLEASSEEVISSGLAIPEAGTYYVTVIGVEETDVDFTLSADIYSSDDSLMSGESKVVTLLSEKDSKYYEINLKSQGTVKLTTTYDNVLILTTDKTTKEDWYKVKLTKDQAIELTLSGEVNGDVTLSFYDSENYLFGKLYIAEYSSDCSAAPRAEDSKKLPRGTHYIKVTKGESSTSGYYSIKMK